MTDFPQDLDITRRSEDAQKLYDYLMARVIGQERAVRNFVKVFQQITVGLNKSDRPAGVYLFMGPTGVGKTELVKTVAEYVLGSKNAVTRIDCSEFQHSHETAKLIGSPPGYVGYDEKKTGSARLSQKNLDQFQTAKHKINFLLFDEIEESHESLFSAILQILDAGRLTLGNGEEVNFSKTIIIMTSNLGEKETQAALMGKGIGLRPDHASVNDVLTDQVYALSKKAAENRFKAKFMNRLDRIIVFRALEQESLLKILHNELKSLEFRLWAAPSKAWEQGGSKGAFPQFRVIFRTTKAADDKLLLEGTSKIYGARELNRAIERFVAFPLGSLVGSNQLEHGDELEIDYLAEAKELVFRKIAHRDLAPLPPLQYNGMPQPVLPAGYDKKPDSTPLGGLPSWLTDPKNPLVLCKHGVPLSKCPECSVPPTPPIDWSRGPKRWLWNRKNVGGRIYRLED